MIRGLLAFCVRERLVVAMLAVALVVAGWWSATTIPLDAIPNVGENQVIVLTEWPGRSPKDVEDQVTYPMSVALQAVPGSKGVRGRSMFGFSFVQVTFEDAVDFYWARSRVAEQLTTVAGQLPEGVTPQMAPDATALGQIFYYVLDAPPDVGLDELRSLQDFFIKYALQSVEGVAEVASIGGYERQYQIDVDPDRLRFHRLTLRQVIDAVDAANVDVGAKTIESGGMEYLVRGRGFIGAGKTEAETIEQINQTVIATRDVVPVRVSEVASVQAGPAFRRGALDWNGREAVGGVVVMRYGENPRAVIERVKAKIASLEKDLDGIEIVGIYDRTGLIDETVGTLTTALAEETLITLVVVTLFLLHLRSSLVIAVTLPMAVLMSFGAMRLFEIDANIMSLAGIAIAIGTMVDMGIIVLENVYEKLAAFDADDTSETELPSRRDERRTGVIIDAAGEVVPAVMTAVTTTIVSFLPVFFLTGRDHKLFAPLAWTKTFALAASLIVAVTVVPMLAQIMLRQRRTKGRPWVSGLVASLSLAGLAAGLVGLVWANVVAEHLDVRVAIGLAALFAAAAGWWMTRERLRPMEQNPVTQLMRWLYAGRLRLALRRKLLMLAFPATLFVVGLGAWIGLPTVMQPVERLARSLGTDLNGVPSYVEAKHAFPGLESDDWIALDEGSWFYMPSLYPGAGFGQVVEILQTQDVLIGQIPEVEHVLGKVGRIDSALDPAPAAMVETYITLKPRDQWRPGATEQDIWDEINAAATLPGVTPASPLQPIEGRVVMLQSGIKASMAVRIYGETLDQLSVAAREVAANLKDNPYVNPGTVNPDLVLGKPYVEFEVDREQAARYGMTVRGVNQIVAAGLGGVDVTTTVEGRERYPIQVRYRRDFRERVDHLGQIPVVTPTGDVVPLKRLASIETTWGPGVISSEDSRLVAHVPFSPSGLAGDLETVEQLMVTLGAARTDGSLQLPDGSLELVLVGSFENQIEANRRLLWILPTVFLINLLLHYLHFRNLSLALVVFSGIPVACAGGMIAVALAGVELNTAVWIGFIALAGLAADDGIVMASYIHDRLKTVRIESIEQLREEVYEAGLRRIRPCVMTTVTTLVALLPVLLSDGRGADVARAMALPVFGGMLAEPFTTFVVPTLYCGWLELKLRLNIYDDLLTRTPASPLEPSEAA